MSMRRRGRRRGRRRARARRIEARMDSSVSRGTRQILESLARAGVTSLPKAVAVAAAPVATAISLGQPLAAEKVEIRTPAMTSGPTRAVSRALLLDGDAEGAALPVAERSA